MYYFKIVKELMLFNLQNEGLKTAWITIPNIIKHF